MRLTSSSCLSRFISDGIKPAYFFRQLWNVASLMPDLRHTSPMAVPPSACRKTKAIYASVNLDAFMLSLCFKPNPKLEPSSRNRSKKRALRRRTIKLMAENASLLNELGRLRRLERIMTETGKLP